MRKGTIIEVSELFYNTPARLKFMKSLNAELALTVNYIEKIALSHPDISIALFNDGKEMIKTSGSNDIYKVIHEIFGLNVSKNMIKIEAENYDYIINGYISNLNLSKSNRNSMITLVNGRVVSNQSVNRTIKDAYHTVLAENKFPIVVINIETDPTLIDVNIHPTKQDIKFSKLESLDDLLFSTIRTALNEADNTFKGYQEEVKESPVDYNHENNYKYTKRKIEDVRLQFDDEQEEIKYDSEAVKKEDVFIKPVGLALGTYLIAQDENIMYMIDIHAANERINYERYMEALKKPM